KSVPHISIIKSLISVMIGVTNSTIDSHTLIIVSLNFSHSSKTDSLNSSFVLNRYIKPATSPAMAAVTNPTGVSNAPITAKTGFINAKSPERRLDILNIGPNAISPIVTNRATWVIVSFKDGDRSSHQDFISLTPSTIVFTNSLMLSPVDLNQPLK